MLPQVREAGRGLALRFPSGRTGVGDGIETKEGDFQLWESSASEPVRSPFDFPQDGRGSWDGRSWPSTSSGRTGGWDGRSWPSTGSGRTGELGWPFVASNGLRTSGLGPRGRESPAQAGIVYLT